MYVHMCWRLDCMYSCVRRLIPHGRALACPTAVRALACVSCVCCMRCTHRRQYQRSPANFRLWDQGSPANYRLWDQEGPTFGYMCVGNTRGPTFGYISETPAPIHVSCHVTILKPARTPTLRSKDIYTYICTHICSHVHADV